MTDTYRPGILGTTGSFGSIQFTDGNDGGSQIEIMDSSQNLKNIQDVQVSGAVDFDSTLNVDGEATLASAKVSDLTDGRIVIAGTDGALEDDVGLTYNGSKLSATGVVSGSGQLQGASVAVDGNVSAANGSFSGDMTITGDLTVNGSTTTVNTTNLDVTDNMVLLNDGVSAGANANDSGILIERGSTGDNAFMGWDESEDKFILGTTEASSDATGNLTINAATLVVNDVEGNLTGNVSGNVTGQVSDISNHDTGDLTEGSNLYYLDSRARAALSDDDMISYNSTTGVISVNASEFTSSFNTALTAAAGGVRQHLTGGYMIDYNQDDGAYSIDASEFTASFNTALTAAAGGVRQHLTSGYMIDYSAGQFSIDANEFSASFNTALTAAAGGVRQHFTGGDNITITNGDVALDSRISLTDITASAVSASAVSASAFHVAGQASIAYDTSLDLSTGGAALQLSTGSLSSSVDFVAPNVSASMNMSASETIYAGQAFEVGLSSLQSGMAQIGSGSIEHNSEDKNLIIANTDDDQNVMIDFGHKEGEASGSFSLRDGDENVLVKVSNDDTNTILAFVSSTGSITNIKDPSNPQDAATKAYVDAQLTSQDLDFQGDSGGALSIDLDTETLSIVGTANEIETAGSGNQLQIGLPDNVTISGNFTVNGNIDLGSDVDEDTISVLAQFDQALIPSGSGAVDLGRNDNRWGDVYATNVYTGDFHMKNERGDWTLFEESDHIRIRNNATGQEFKLDMTPVKE